MKKDVFKLESKPLLMFTSPDDFRGFPRSQVIQVGIEEAQVLEVRQAEVMLEEKVIANELQEDSQHSSSQQIENEVLIKQLEFLSRPFQQQVYQPLALQLNDSELLVGKILAVEGLNVQVSTANGEVMIDANDIKDLYWRGKAFPKI